MEERRRGLGRGLSALFSEEKEDAAALEKVRQVRMVPVERLRPGKFQPRRHFDEASMKALVESVKDKGVLQPILARRDAKKLGEYEIVAGERRWRAAQAAQVHEVPVIVRELGDRETLEIALVENIQRQDLTPIEEGEAYQQLLDEFGYTQEELARSVGKSRSHVANMMRLIALPDDVKEMLGDGRLTAGHARALLGADDPSGLAANIVLRGLSVRETETLTGAAKGRKPAAAKGVASGAAASGAKDADTRALERDISHVLGLKVTLDVKGKGGTLAIHYTTLDQLDDVLKRLKT